MQGHCECLAATFTRSGLLPSLLALIHSCLLLGQKLHKRPTFTMTKKWVCAASDSRFPDEQGSTEPWWGLAVSCAPKGAAVVSAVGVSKEGPVPGMLRQ